MIFFLLKSRSFSTTSMFINELECMVWVINCSFLSFSFIHQRILLSSRSSMEYLCCISNFLWLVISLTLEISSGDSFTLFIAPVKFISPFIDSILQKLFLVDDIEQLSELLLTLKKSNKFLAFDIDKKFFYL